MREIDFDPAMNPIDRNIALQYECARLRGVNAEVLAENVELRKHAGKTTTMEFDPVGREVAHLRAEVERLRELLREALPMIDDEALGSTDAKKRIRAARGEE